MSLYPTGLDVIKHLNHLTSNDKALSADIQNVENMNPEISLRLIYYIQHNTVSKSTFNGRNFFLYEQTISFTILSIQNLYFNALDTTGYEQGCKFSLNEGVKTVSYMSCSLLAIIK